MHSDGKVSAAGSRSSVFVVASAVSVIELCTVNVKAVYERFHALC